MIVKSDTDAPYVADGELEAELDGVFETDPEGEVEVEAEGEVDGLLDAEAEEITVPTLPSRISHL
jgi:hypothetical protein